MLIPTSYREENMQPEPKISAPTPIRQLHGGGVWGPVQFAVDEVAAQRRVLIVASGAWAASRFLRSLGPDAAMWEPGEVRPRTLAAVVLVSKDPAPTTSDTLILAATTSVGIARWAAWAEKATAETIAVGTTTLPSPGERDKLKLHGERAAEMVGMAPQAGWSAADERLHMKLGRKATRWGRVPSAALAVALSDATGREVEDKPTVITVDKSTVTEAMRSDWADRHPELDSFADVFGRTICREAKLAELECGALTNYRALLAPDWALQAQRDEMRAPDKGGLRYERDDLQAPAWDRKLPYSARTVLEKVLRTAGLLQLVLGQHPIETTAQMSSDLKRACLGVPAHQRPVLLRLGLDYRRASDTTQTFASHVLYRVGYIRGRGRDHKWGEKDYRRTHMHHHVLGPFYASDLPARTNAENSMCHAGATCETRESEGSGANPNKETSFLESAPGVQESMGTQVAPGWHSEFSALARGAEESHLGCEPGDSSGSHPGSGPSPVLGLLLDAAGWSAALPSIRKNDGNDGNRERSCEGAIANTVDGVLRLPPLAAYKPTSSFKAGRIYGHWPSSRGIVQGVPGVLRKHLHAMPGRTLLSFDFKNAHFHIAAQLSRPHDQKKWFQRLVLQDVYSTLGAELGITREHAKVVALALLNGGGFGAVSPHCPQGWSIEQVEKLIKDWRKKAIAWERTKGALWVSQKPVRCDENGVPLNSDKIGSMELQRIERKLLDLFLAEVQKSPLVRVLVPMYDGCLLDCATSDVFAATSVVHAAARAAADALGFPNMKVTTGAGQTWADAEE